MATTVLVTGVSRYLGGRFARLLTAEPGVDRVIGVDVIPPPHDIGGAEFVRADIRNPMIGKIIAQAERRHGRAHERHRHADLRRRAGLPEGDQRHRHDAAAGRVPEGSEHPAGSWSSPPPRSTAPRRATPRCSPRTWAPRRCRGPASARTRSRSRATCAGSPAAGPTSRSRCCAWPTSSARASAPASPTTSPCRSSRCRSATTPACSSCTRTTRCRRMCCATTGPPVGIVNVAGDGVVTVQQAARLAGRPVGAGADGGDRAARRQFVRRSGLADFSARPDAVPRLRPGLDTTRMRQVLAPRAAVHHARGLRGLRRPGRHRAAGPGGASAASRTASPARPPASCRTPCAARSA